LHGMQVVLEVQAEKQQREIERAKNASRRT
jgi:hypothetical protein